MKLANILFIASAVSFVAAYDVCAQNTATKTAPATDKPLTPSPMTEAQKIDFIKGATEEQMKSFITNATAEEVDDMANKIFKNVEKNPKDTDYVKKALVFFTIIENKLGASIDTRNKTLAQLKAQADFHKGIAEQTRKEREQARKEKEDAQKQIAEAKKEMQEGIDAIE
jgi:hypothetical protein